MACLQYPQPIPGQAHAHDEWIHHYGAGLLHYLHEAPSALGQCSCGWGCYLWAGLAWGDYPTLWFACLQRAPWTVSAVCGKPKPPSWLYPYCCSRLLSLAYHSSV